jgi:hypothetical protein
MSNEEKKNLKRMILSKGSDCIIKYNSDHLGKTYFIPKEIRGEVVYGYVVTISTNPSYNLSLDSLLEHDKLSVASFKKLK